jgi:hypothetical protein
MNFDEVVGEIIKAVAAPLPHAPKPSNALSSHHPIFAQLPDLGKGFEFDGIVFSRMAEESKIFR